MPTSPLLPISPTSTEAPSLARAVADAMPLFYKINQFVSAARLAQDHAERQLDGPQLGQQRGGTPIRTCGKECGFGTCRPGLAFADSSWADGCGTGREGFPVLGAQAELLPWLESAP